MRLSESKDPVDSLREDLELLERHISILKTVKENQPIGLIRLAEITGIPKHRVRYSLKIMEQQAIIEATSNGAIVSEDYDEFMKNIVTSIEGLADQIDGLRDSLKKEF